MRKPCPDHPPLGTRVYIIKEQCAGTVRFDDFSEDLGHLFVEIDTPNGKTPLRYEWFDAASLRLAEDADPWLKECSEPSPEALDATANRLFPTAAHWQVAMYDSEESARTRSDNYTLANDLTNALTPFKFLGLAVSQLQHALDRETTRLKILKTLRERIVDEARKT
jgi:hypothetical protein